MLDGWDHYCCLIAGRPAAVLVDLDVEVRAPCSGLSRLVCVRLALRAPGDDGLATAEESAALDALETELRGRLQAGRYVARVTTDGRAELHFYLPDDEGVRSTVEAALSNHGYEGDVSASDDLDWEWFLGTLLPSPLERQKMLNRRRIDDLAPVGAVLVKHTLLFPTAISRDTALSALLRRGFTMEGPVDAEGVLRFGLVLTQTSELSAAALDRAVEVLFEQAEDQGGAYLEWTL
ncbi:MAG TPA: DUF695 domain-containing protein [Myxococcota bacterium]|nr:DUF695 domain-containing protein [Myxococcota bacterium]